MSEYKTIFGKPVKFLATDPANDAEGQVWYNSTSGTFKSVLSVGAWSSGGSLITARNSIRGAGTQTSALGFGGTTTIPNPQTASLSTEEYNGSGWASSGNLNTTRVFGGGTGTQTAGLAFAGGTSGTPPFAPMLNSTEEYDGSTWTNVPGTMATARNLLSGAGIQTAALAITGYTGTAVTNATEEYDGSTWTAGGNVGSTRYNVGAAGTQTAGLAFGGSGTSSATEEYDGSSWTAGGSLNTGRNGIGGSGIQTAAIGFGGNPTTGATELYNGSTWTTSSASLGTARYNLGSAINGTNSATLAFGGRTATIQSSTEEFNFSATVITGAAWSSGGSMNTSRSYMAGLGTRPASLAAGGSTSSPGLNQTANSEEYDGTSWSEGNNLGTARVGLGGAGSQTSSIAAGGRTPSDVDAANSEEYNGTSWTATPSLSTGRRYVAGFGASETAAVVVGGTVGGAPGAGTKQTATEEYNGSSWTSGGAMNTAKTGTDGNSVGTETAGLYITGNAGVEEYNGTTWSEVNDLQRPAPGNGGGACGVQTSALFAGAAAYETKTEIYDGTSFKTTASLGTGRAYSGGSGASSATGTIFGGRNSPSSPRTTGATEEFNPETTALNLKTLTTS